MTQKGKVVQESLRKYFSDYHPYFLLTMAPNFVVSALQTCMDVAKGLNESLGSLTIHITAAIPSSEDTAEQVSLGEEAQLKITLFS